MDTKQKIDEILSETGKAVLGKQEVLSRILTAILAGGHILIDDIPGVGATRKRALLAHFGSAQAVARAGVEDLMAVDGISAAMAQTIHDFFHERG